jgi:hypothetical protein
VKSSESSRGSAPKIGRVAVGTSSSRNCGVTLFCLTQLSRVWPSHSAALAEFQGASTGTSVDIWSSLVTTRVMSGSSSGSGGAVPVGPVSL